MLLRPGGPPLLDERAVATPVHPAAPALPAGPDAILALDADRLLRLLALCTGRPPRWTAPAFGREVDLVRAHLGPIRSREMLAASFGREAFHGRAAAGSDRALGGSAVRVGYALRWLELGGASVSPTWRAVLEG